MIKSDITEGATMLANTITLAEQIGCLSDCLPEVIVALGTGTAILLRDLQCFAIEQELARF